MFRSVKTSGGVNISITQEKLIYGQAIESLIDKLDAHQGALFASSYEYPGRYTCWDIGFFNPPLVIECRQKKIRIKALNSRGKILMQIISPLLHGLNMAVLVSESQENCELEILTSESFFSEEERSRQPSVFNVLRELIAFFKSPDEPYLGVYGAFGYDLIFQFEALHKHQVRDMEQRDMVLYLPDEIYVVNHRKEEAFIRRYEFEYGNKTTAYLTREGTGYPYHSEDKPTKKADHEVGEYARIVELAKERFACGDLFEVVPSQTFYSHFTEQPSSLFRRMRQLNPSPYGFFINLGEGEYLVGASPEMYVRVQGNRVETCPISGTIQRGTNAIEDAKNIQRLLDSEKEASELTMCTDVDRNDKSRICEAGSVEVIGRRQIEMYSRLIHTVDHVEGTLRKEFDAIDAFLTHMWVVTVTGAPKLWAMNFIEKHEKSPRKWYAGAVGWMGFDGNMNTGLVLRTVRIKKGIAELRVGATLLYDSNAEAEEQETRLKASAFLDMLNNNKPFTSAKKSHLKTGVNKKVLLIDHQDSFVHTLANYFRQTGAEVITVRFDRCLDYLEDHRFDLVVLSPGPGKPADFNISQTISAVLSHGIPLFGVCLGLQGIVEYFGGSLGVLDYPMHGKSSLIQVQKDTPLFHGLGKSFSAARYHSLYAFREHLPEELIITAVSGDDNVIMAITHQSLPIHAVQFHPEALLSLPENAGIKIITNLMDMVGLNA
ncbi:anthranilate synthase component I [Legionella israelensis]|uniref:Anthranilate synthase n=1 Tax=Legionella israelensis TaxID=454 RepID=A0AAX1EGX8_9GAMM|nr:anthranilate synthase component I [Legionella israelensis]QBR84292.1 anthranilate synthase component I [Legionella israelensis]